MLKYGKWLAAVVAVFVLVLAAVAVALQHWLRTDDFRGRVGRQATAALGVPLEVGKLSVDLFPLPAVAADQVRVQTHPALTLDRVEARPVWAALLAGRLQIATLVVRKAVLPQTAITAIAATLQKKDKGAAQKPRAAASAGSTAVVFPRSVVLDDITWIDEKGQRLTIDAKAKLDGDGLLDEASFKVRAGRFAGAHGEVKHEGSEWPLNIAIGGGRITGKLQLSPAKAVGAQLLEGELTTRDVEVAALTAPSKPLTGKLEAQTSLHAEYRDPGQIVEALQTHTLFSVREAVVRGIDLERAVHTVGLSRGGDTRLDTLAGQVNTQGKTVHLTSLVASSGTLTANGNVTLLPNRSLDGRVAVELGSGGLGVPLAVGGTLDSPSVTLTRSASAGAAVGTSVGGWGDKISNGFHSLFGK